MLKPKKALWRCEVRLATVGLGVAIKRINRDSSFSSSVVTKKYNMQGWFTSSVVNKNWIYSRDEQKKK